MLDTPEACARSAVKLGYDRTAAERSVLERFPGVDAAAIIAYARVEHAVAKAELDRLEPAENVARVDGRPRCPTCGNPLPCRKSHLT
jgi:hypothetical protein